MSDSKTATEHMTCAYCDLFYPCPCGECSYDICCNTFSQWPHEYVHEDMDACDRAVIVFGGEDWR